MNMNQYGSTDNRSTVMEWPIQVKSIEEIPEEFREKVLELSGGSFSDYEIISAPVRKTAPDSFAYVFGYGREKILYVRKLQEEIVGICILKEEICKIAVSRELLNEVLTLHYRSREEAKALDFPHVASVYYLYDPFLNWLLGREKDFLPQLAEKTYPRPERLYRESLVMYNFSLSAYRFGDGFDSYEYTAKKYRKRWTPWKTYLEEWLEIPMKQGRFWLHSKEYLTEYAYIFHQ